MLSAPCGRPATTHSTSKVIANTIAPNPTLQNSRNRTEEMTSVPASQTATAIESVANPGRHTTTRRELLEMRVVDEREPERRGQHPPRQRGERRAPDATAAGGAVPPFRHPGVFYAGAFGPARRCGDVSSHRDAVGRVDPVERPP